MTQAQFIARWNKAKSLAAFAEAAGILPTSASVRASKYRSLGFELKEFPRGRRAA